MADTAAALFSYLLVFQGANELCDFGILLSGLVVLVGALPLVLLAAAAQTRQTVLACAFSFLAAPFLFLLAFGTRNPPCGEPPHLESTAVANLRTITTAEVTYLSSAGRYGTIDQLITEGLLDDRFLRFTGGYRYNLILSPTGYTAYANAVSSSAKYDFYSVEDGVIHYSPDSRRSPRNEAGLPVQ